MWNKIDLFCESSVARASLCGLFSLTCYVRASQTSGFDKLYLLLSVTTCDFINSYFVISIPLMPYSYGVEVFIFFFGCTQSVGLLGRVISPSQGLYLNTGQYKHRKTRTHSHTHTPNNTNRKTHTHTHTHTHTPNIRARSGIRTHDHSVRASEDVSWLRPLGYRDRPNSYILFSLTTKNNLKY
jgi:hypothetical protein